LPARAVPRPYPNSELATRGEFVDRSLLIGYSRWQTGSERNRRRLRELLVGVLAWTDQDCVSGLFHRVLLD
jgi:hypothetical protein